MPDLPADAITAAENAAAAIHRVRCPHRSRRVERGLIRDWPQERAEIAYHAFCAAWVGSRAEEREACAQLAEQHDATWRPTATCDRDCSRGPHPYPSGPPRPFADLIRARTSPTEGTPS